MKNEMKVYEYAEKALINKEESCIINLGLASYFLGTFDIAEKLKKEYPNALILMDLKLADNDYLNAKIAFDAGADIVSVLGSASEETMKNVVMLAEENNAHVMVINANAEQNETADIYGVEYTASATDSNMTSCVQAESIFAWMKQQDIAMELAI